MYIGIKHIFFDLDDTLWDFEKNSSFVLQQIFNEYYLSQKLNTNFETFHSAYKQTNAFLWSEYNKGKIDKEFFRNNRFNKTFKIFGYHNYNENIKITQHYLSQAPYEKHLKDDCFDTLDYLKNKYQLHIITNGFKETQNIKLHNSGLRKYFSKVIISEEHSLAKPDEKIFRLSEKLTNCNKEDCVMVGDNFECDIEGALNAGWKAIWFTGLPEEEKFHQIKKLIELKDFF